MRFVLKENQYSAITFAVVSIIFNGIFLNTDPTGSGGILNLAWLILNIIPYFIALMFSSGYSLEHPFTFLLLSTVQWYFIGLLMYLFVFKNGESNGNLLEEKYSVETSQNSNSEPIIEKTCWNCLHYKPRNFIDPSAGNCHFHRRKTLASDVCEDHSLKEEKS
jgi:hypothetical protein